MQQLYEQIASSVRFIHTVTDFQPEYGIILGTGLGHLTDDVEIVAEIPYTEIPHFPESTVQSHEGKLVFGHLSGRKVVVMAGRFHYYEGYSMLQVTFPVRVLNLLGVHRLIITNVSGGIHADYFAGDLVVIRDHINLQPENPLRGENDDRLGSRFPDMLHVYDAEMNARAVAIAQGLGYRVHLGVYAAVQGPNLETPAEYEYLHRIGADLVGMSTVPEVIVARHMGTPVCVISIVSNKCYPLDAIRETTVDDVIAVANAAEPKMRAVIKELIRL